MDEVKRLLGRMRERLTRVASANAVVGQTISVGDRHVVPLCELGLTFGGGGAGGEGTGGDGAPGRGTGSGAGAAGGAKATPVAVVVVEDGVARLERLEV